MSASTSATNTYDGEARARDVKPRTPAGAPRAAVLSDLSTFGVHVRRVRALAGPNLYAYLPVLQAIVDVGPYEERGSHQFPGVIDRLVGWLPGLLKHECSVGKPGGFVERLARGTYLGHMAEHVTLELQLQMGFRVAFGRVRGTGERGVYNLVVEYEEEEPGRAALQAALRCCLAALHDLPFDVEAELRALQRVADRYRLGPSTAAIVAAARKRNIPVLRLAPTTSLVQLGHGMHQKRISASETSNTSSIAVDMCQEKPVTNRMLRTVAVPVPTGESVGTADEAWQAAQRVGPPVVLKPRDGNQGKGVSVDLTSETDVRAAFEIAARQSARVLVEKYIEGHDYRLLVVGGKMVAAARRDPAQVRGDGEHTVQELVQLVNRDPQRRPGHSGRLTQIKLDRAALLVLEQQGLNPNSVPAVGQTVRLRSNGNLSTGGTATDVTDEVHPRNAYFAELAGQILGLDVAGVDMICRDISRPLTEQDGAIVEVNAAPGLRMHLYPSSGQGRDVATPIVEMLYPGAAPSRIPIVAVTGTNGKTTVTRLVSHIFETAGHVVGMTSTEGVYVNQARVMSGDCSGPKSARTVLLHPHVEVAVLETARGGILREGLAFDECSTAVVTNLSADHLGLDGVQSLEELAQVKQVVVEAVGRQGAAVLNAADPLVAEMAAATDARVIYVAPDPDNAVLQAHLARDGQAVFVQNEHIVLATGKQRHALAPLRRVGFSHGGKIRFQVENALLATAAAWAEGVGPAIIARALTTFETNFRTTPGRFNRLEVDGVEVLVDYAHNPAALAALGEAVQQLGERPTTMALGLPGDRRDEDIATSVQATVPYVDRYVLFDHSDRREREPGETPALIRSHLPEDAPVTIVSDEATALQQAWQDTPPGGRLIIIADVAEQTLRTVEALIDRAAACESPIGTRAQADGG